MGSTEGPTTPRRLCCSLGWLLPSLVLVVAAVAVGDRPQVSGTRLVLEMQALRVGSDGTSSTTTHRVLPDGRAELEFLTDGQSVRKTLHGRMLGLANGSVGLVRSGSERQFTLDPAARTYFVTDPVATENAPTGELRIERTANYDTILGHRAQRIVVSSSEAMTDSSGKSVQFKTEVETWCAQDPKLPRSVADATKMGLMLLGRGNRKQYDEICPVALRSRLRTLWSPGVELSWSVTAIEKVATVPEMFTVPAGYREVEAPRR